ncbi:DNA damage-binding protein CMR1 [Candida viswanathii]|uniref:DNA damage-binding protein CMR1 n=1 Tax=Candida viswanathii TaxID=5486 RepID=A0A367YHE5_9ASCO|nr:DNA damage-binding protein CMR1 [Candida viswanathii]
MVLSELEKKRLENIQKNQKLLQLLQLDSLKNEIEASATPKQQKRTRLTKKKAAVKNEPVAPTRRSRRIAGIKEAIENPEEYERQRAAEEEARLREQQQRRQRLIGDFNIAELLSGSSDGGDVEINTRALDLVKSLGDKISTGDFYDLIREKATGLDASLEQKRREFDNLRIYERFDPLDIKITEKRITSIAFHPAKEDRIVGAGDTDGNLGLWLVDDKSNEEAPLITILRQHGKNVSRVAFAPQSAVLTSSYDGSLRSLDLLKQVSKEVTYLSDPDTGAALGISHFEMVGDLIYMTTLSGEFYKYDTREPPKERLANRDLLRLHDKKIGGFDVNPNSAHQIATSSLDRSMRIWDLRKVGRSVYSEFERQRSPHLYGNYTSRLSISCVSWNQDNGLVANGYDDYIELFNYNGGDGTQPITEWSSDYQPPGKKKVEPPELPDNLVPFTKLKHNCQTGRWVSILKSTWQKNPADGVQKFIIANMNRGLDIYDQQGNIMAHLNENVGAVPAVSALHPTQNWAVGGSASGKVYLFE